MNSKMILVRSKVFTEQEAWVIHNKEALATQLDKLLGKPKSMEEMVEAISRLIRSSARKMTAADEAHLLELQEDKSERVGRDLKAEKLGDVVQFARSAIEPIYGVEGLRAVGLEDKVYRSDPAAVLKLARRFVASVDAEGFEMVGPKKAGVALDVAVLAAEVKQLLPALDAALKTVADEEASAQITQVAKNQAVESFERAYAMGTNVMHALAMLVGNREMAKSIPTLPHSKPAAPSEEEAEPPVAAPPA